MVLLSFGTVHASDDTASLSNDIKSEDVIARNSNYNKSRFAKCRGGRTTGNVGGSFSLTNQEGIRVTDIDVIDKPSLIYFGYTFSPDLSVQDTYRNVAAVTILEEYGLEVIPIFITVDPLRDTPELLKQFTDYMHPKMVGLTGSLDEIKKVADKYRVYFKKQNTDDRENYLVDHTTFTYLVLPEIGFVDFFKRELTAKHLAKNVSCFTNYVKQLLKSNKCEYCNLGEADLQGVNLTSAYLKGGDLENVNLQGANLTGVDLRYANLTGANLQGANLTNANLTGANLQRADLTGANLEGANLTGAILQFTNLTGANFRYAVLKKVKSEGAILINTIRPDGKVIDMVFGETNLND